MQYIVNCINPEGPGFESQPLHICVGKAWGLKQPFPRPRTVREAYGTGYALFFLVIGLFCSKNVLLTLLIVTA